MIHGDLGDVDIDRVVEFSGPIRTVTEILPDVPAEFWSTHEDLLAPDFWGPRTGAYLANVQTWVLRRRGLTIVVDTGIGNDRARPQIPVFSHLQTDFLARLGAVVRPDEVDVVVNTHIHYDHVGWNTTLVDGEWRHRSCGRSGAAPSTWTRPPPGSHAGRGSRRPPAPAARP